MESYYGKIWEIRKKNETKWEKIIFYFFLFIFIFLIFMSFRYYILSMNYIYSLIFILIELGKI